MNEKLKIKNIMKKLKIVNLFNLYLEVDIY